MSEAQIQHDIRLALGREPGLVLWRNSVGAVEIGGRWQRVGLCPGSADLIGILGPTGRMVCLEVKTRSGRMSTDQRLFADLVRRHGGFYALVRSVDDARLAIERARENQTGDDDDGNATVKR